MKIVFSVELKISEKLNALSKTALADAVNRTIQNRLLRLDQEREEMFWSIRQKKYYGAQNERV